MGTKKAREIKKGDKIVVDGVARDVKHARAHRQYAGYVAIQYAIGERVTQGDYRSDMDVEVLDMADGLPWGQGPHLIDPNHPSMRRKD